MKAILYRETLGARLEEVPVPEIGAGEALVAVEACGLCGTDLMKLSAKAKGAVLGHEVAGRIAKIDGRVNGFQEGDRVVVAHHVPCLSCHYCRRGSFSMCRQFKATNIDPGGFAEFVRVPALHARHTMLNIPDGLDLVAASQTEPLACCLRNVKRLGLSAGDTAGIVGLGAIGILTAQLLKLRGVEVRGIDIDAARSQALKPWGKGYTDPSLFRKELNAQTQGRGLDALIFTAGTAALVSERLSWIRDGGTLNIFASFHPPCAELDLNEIYHRELGVISSYSPSLEDLRQSLDLIASGAVSLKPLGMRTFALEEFGEAERSVRSRRIMKAVLAPAARVAAR